MATAQAPDRPDGKAQNRNQARHRDDFYYGNQALHLRGRNRQRFCLRPPTPIVRVTVYPVRATETAPDRVARIVVFAPVAEVGRFGTFGARWLGSARMVFLFRFVLAACITPGTTVDAATGVTVFRLFAPMAAIRVCAIPARSD
mmetsp:Transcript_16979/g.34922  ORF Transcript_16979/g.34922 Transcript_16979/m.34922 type:complete len:144 (+) Transcript_16979:412-843(+)